MPIRTRLTLAGCACLAAAGFFAPSAGAEPVLAELRVEGPAGTLDPGTWYVTDSEQIRKSRPGDACIRDEGRLEFPGPTALGILQSGSEHTAALRQVRVRLDEAGPFVCEIGDISGRAFGDPAGFSGWIYWQNQVSGSSSADLATVADGDQVLWLFSDFGSALTNTGDALELLGVPPGDVDGSFEVQVVAHAFDGASSPAEGATIAGATQATALGGGRYAVTVPEGRTTLTATRGSDTPSNHVTACFDADPTACPSAHGRTIFGSELGDRLPGTAGWDRIDSGRGNDRIDLRLGGRDRVSCGGGTDTVLRKGSDADDRIAANCERIRRR
jgi:hypothetical protein